MVAANQKNQRFCEGEFFGNIRPKNFRYLVAEDQRTVTLNSEMDFYLRNGRNGDFFYEMELQNSIFIHYLEKYLI